MTHPDNLAHLEATIGQELKRILPPADTPADVSERIRQRLNAATHREGLVAVPTFPPKGVRRPTRWLVGVAVIAMLMAATGLGLDRFRHSGSQGAPLNLAGPLFFGSSALAASRELPSRLPHSDYDASFRLDTTLPTLPESGPVSTLTAAAWQYTDEAAEAGSGTGRTPDDPVAAEQAAIAWLKEHGRYPSGPVNVVTHAHPEFTTVRLTPAPGSEFASMNENPQIFVGLNGTKVFTVQALWPEGTAGTVTVPLKTADQAWTDLQAGNGIWLGIPDDEPSFGLPKNAVLSVSDVKLDRAMVRSADDQWYMIPVVVFHATVTDADGQQRSLVALVSAVRPD